MYIYREEVSKTSIGLDKLDIPDPGRPTRPSNTRWEEKEASG